MSDGQLKPGNATRSATCAARGPEQQATVSKNMSEGQLKPGNANGLATIDVKYFQYAIVENVTGDRLLEVINTKAVEEFLIWHNLIFRH